MSLMKLSTMASAKRPTLPRKNASTHGPSVSPVGSSRVLRFVSRQRSLAL